MYIQLFPMIFGVTLTFTKIDRHRVREFWPLVVDVNHGYVEGTGTAEGWLSVVHCLYGQAVAVLYFIVQREGGHYNATVGRVDLEGEPLVASYDVVCYVCIAVWVSICGKYLLITIKNISDYKTEILIRNSDLKKWMKRIFYLFCRIGKLVIHWGLKKTPVFIVLPG